MLTRLRINGKPLPKICNQWVIDLTEYDNFVLPEDPLAAPVPLPAPEAPKQQCECGAKAIGIHDFMPGHSPWCPVEHNRTPLSHPRFP